MELITLDKDQVASIYNERMVHDFKKGYTFLVRQGKRYLVDYLAVYPEERDKGRGATILKLLSEYITDAEIVVVEVEDPFYAESSEEKEIQERRVSFYLRNNCVDTGVRVRCFGVPFILISFLDKSSLDRSTVWEIYQSFYRAVLPKKMFDANIELISNADLGE